jgi:orotidine-5'-phosphate decarboxylase
MTRQELIKSIQTKQSFLCIGLDTDLTKIPKFLLGYDDPIFEFNKRIIDATHDLCVAYKPNIAFYECHGSKGWDSLKKTIDHIPKGLFTIADAKRGDIGNTSTYYAKTFFEYLNFDAVTVAPYMGADSVTPFLEFKDKWVILLALTSNPGAMDFQFMTNSTGEKLYEKVIRKSSQWAGNDRLMYVVGATRGEGIGEVRKCAGDYFFLVPGVGAQGGSLQDVAKYGLTKDCGLLVNSSRAILYAGGDENFAEAARKEARSVQTEMAEILRSSS